MGSCGIGPPVYKSPCRVTHPHTIPVKAGLIQKVIPTVISSITGSWWRSVSCPPTIHPLWCTPKTLDLLLPLPLPHVRGDASLILKTTCISFCLLCRVLFWVLHMVDYLLWNCQAWLLTIESLVSNYEIIGKYSKSYLASSSSNRSWFMQYIKSDNEESLVL